MTTSRAFLALLAVLVAPSPAAARVPAVCTGWPSPNGAYVSTSDRIYQFLYWNSVPDDVLSRACSNLPRWSRYVSETNYTNPDLPDLLTMLNGTTVSEDGPLWRARRAEIKFLLHKYFYGTLPEENPPLVAVNASSAVAVRGGISQHIELTYLVLGTTNVSFTIELIRPTGDGPHPLFLTQANHRRWAIKAVSRGYAACIYPGADVDDQSLEFRAAYQKATPAPTWGTILSRSWLASRSLDHLLTLDFINKARVTISGHSRNGKQAMLAGAFDERVTAVVSSSSGSPGMCPYRTTSANTFAEGPGDAPPPWWIPELSCFKGHEHRLPIDSHGLLALIAPRHMMAATARTEGCEPAWAVERSYKAGREVYRMLGVPDNLRIKYRPGQHHGFLVVVRCAATLLVQ